MTLEVHGFTVGPFATNCWLVVETESRDAILFDAGMDPEVLVRGIREADANLLELINTHGHIDHVAGNRVIQETFGVRSRIHPDDAAMLETIEMQARMFGVEATNPPPPDGWLAAGDIVELGTHRFEVRHVPGHSPGSVAFVEHAAQVCIVGDLIFAGSVGRTDLPGGDFAVLEHSIRTQIYTLPDEVQLFPGHMGVTSVGRERAGNPFVQG